MGGVQAAILGLIRGLGLHAWASSRVEAGPPLLRFDGASNVQTAARCQPGYRKSTVTGLCVRKTPRWPMLGWN